MFEDTAGRFEKEKIIPLATLTDQNTALMVMKALIDGGINVLEVTFRSTEGESGMEKIAGCIKALRSNFPQALIGAGTVTNPALAKKAMDAGAQFIVSPGLNKETVSFCMENNLPVFPGVSTASEVEAALSMNLTFLKFFPAEACGGLAYVKALAAPFPNVRFIATGGVNEENFNSYLSCKNILCAGGSWLCPPKAIENKNWAEITSLAKKALSLLQKKTEVKAEKTNVRLEKALYLIPVPLGETDMDKVLPPYNRLIVKQIKHFIVEDIKSARRFLRKLDKDINIDELSFQELNEHTDLRTIGHYLDPLSKQGKAMGVISEAGCPAVADPGAAAVHMAQQKGLAVIPLSGPSSMILSVMASGFNGQSFAFNGYISVKDGERASKIRQLENRAWNEDQTQLFIEAPYRNLKMFDAILKNCRKETQLGIAANITCEGEFIKTHTIAEWRKLGAPDINKVPAIFLLYRS